MCWRSTFILCSLALALAFTGIRRSFGVHRHWCSLALVYASVGSVDVGVGDRDSDSDGDGDLK